MKTLETPLVIGDKVYADSHTFGILEYEVDRIEIQREGDRGIFSFTAIAYYDTYEQQDYIVFEKSDIGWSVFMSREEAEEYLEG